LGLLAALDAPFSRAEDPGLTVTSVVTETRTVEATFQHRGIRWWARRATQARKDANARGRTVARLRRANRTQLSLGADGLTRSFLCIHGGEGSWTDPGAPYWGGVQMDRTFMAEYGGPFYRAWGTADHWPPFIQIAVAEAAYLSGRGFGPWPQTSRACGL
jgi:hypothetical protein